VLYTIVRTQEYQLSAVIKPRTTYIAHLEEKGNPYKILLGKPEGNRQLE
jgi:hypothetical protein